jgi:hypothetical protein
MVGNCRGSQVNAPGRRGFLGNCPDGAARVEPTHATRNCMGRRRRAAAGYHERPGFGATPGSFLAGHQPAPASITHSKVSLPAPALDSSRGSTAGHDAGSAVRAEIQAQCPQRDRAPVRKRHPAAAPPKAPLAARGRQTAWLATGCAGCTVARNQQAGSEPSSPTAGDAGTPVSCRRRNSPSARGNEKARRDSPEALSLGF